MAGQWVLRRMVFSFANVNAAHKFADELIELAPHVSRNKQYDVWRVSVPVTSKREETRTLKLARDFGATYEGAPKAVAEAEDGRQEFGLARAGGARGARARKPLHDRVLRGGEAVLGAEEAAQVIDDEKIARWHEEGATIHELARALAVSQKTIRAALRRMGVKTRSRSVDPWDEERIVDLYLYGHTMARVAALMGRDVGTVQNILQRHGVLRRQEQPISDEQIAEAYTTGMSIRDIAAAYGMSRHAVDAALARVGVARRSKSESNKTPHVLARTARRGAAEDDDDAGFICMGRDVILAFDDGEMELPSDTAILHDPSGRYWPSCSLLIKSFTRGRAAVDAPSDARNFYGRKTPVYEGSIALPPRTLTGWERVGTLHELFYRRAGKHQGKFRHEFNRARGLWKLILVFKKKRPVHVFAHGNALRIELGDDCAVDDRGVIWP